MIVEITPAKLSGKVKIPPSKSVAHRLIISAALAKGTSVISNIYPSKDIIATIEAMKALGAMITLDGDVATVRGIENPPEKAVIDCNESGSTMRFLIPVACALGVECTFLGSGKLPQRPITPYLEELPKHGIEFDFSKARDGDTLPCTLKGKLTAGRFEIDGGISSQFITGLIFALTLLDGDSEIALTSHLESRPYVDITTDCIKSFGGKIAETETSYFVKGSQKLIACNMETEGDFSQCAFFKVANCLGSKIDIQGLNMDSVQGDKKIIEICEKIVYNKNGELSSFVLDCSDIPDLVPILTVLASFCKGISEITNVARLRIKESDRLEAISDSLNKLGCKVTAYSDSLVIEGVESLSGGEVDSYNDHRIAMAMAIACTKCKEPLIIRGAQCVEKSYPNFWEDYKALGGIINVINLE
ncbi:MAG: 3-phosphoshikimate 1-carboxyvinyltransferase [Ruminococcus sp.]|nr:3-phosphoshikimate 1-carboxyvinyltransferase [Ruminococcus sp.]